MMMISTVGVESSHGHDVAADVDGGTSLPGDDKINQNDVFTRKLTHKSQQQQTATVTLTVTVK